MIFIENGNLSFDGKIVEHDYLVFEEEISRGANGIVFLAIDNLLKRKVAFKIWLKINPNDVRDKFRQGVAEAKKTLAANELLTKWSDPKLEDPYFVPDKSDLINNVDKCVGYIFHAGNINGYFYTVMEYINGFTLRNLLNEEDKSIPLDLRVAMDWSDSSLLPFGIKVNIARKLTVINEILISNGIVHGDLHSKNIMITNLSRTKSKGKSKFSYGLKIIDFGTSYFSGRKVGIDRNYIKLIETINECIYPFKLKNIKASAAPSNTSDSNSMTHWIITQLDALRAGFFEKGQEYVGWPYYANFGTYELSTEGHNVDTTVVKNLIDKFVNKNVISFSRKFLGESEDWDTFDGRTAKRGD